MADAAVKNRNYTLELCRLVAAVFVVFLHVPFPGETGGLIVCLSRFAVPMFFAISGYYSYRTKPGKLLRRAGRIWLLELVGIGLTLGWKCVQGHSEGVRIVDSLLWRIPDKTEWIRWATFQVDPFAGHLWYLSAAAVCYVLLAGYVRIFGRRNYRPLYWLSASLLAVFFALSELSDFTGFRVDYTVYRSAWFFGLPMFSMGLLLRQLREGFTPEAKRTALLPLLLTVLGFGLSIVEWKLLGGWDLYLGTVVAAAGLLLLTAARPNVPHWLEGFAGCCGTLSTGIYLIHLIVNEAYGYFFSWKLELPQWQVPLVIAAVSLAVSAAVCVGKAIYKAIKR